MIEISEGIIQDGFTIFLLIAAIAFLWFRRPDSTHRKAPIIINNKNPKQPRRAA